MQSQSQSDEVKVPCAFEFYDKETKSMRACGLESKVMLEDDGYCDEHYVDAIMQLQGRDKTWQMPLSVEKSIKVKKETKSV